MNKLATAIAIIQAEAQIKQQAQPVTYDFWSLDGDLLETYATDAPGWYAGVVAHFHDIHADEVRYEKATT